MGRSANGDRVNRIVSVRVNDSEYKHLKETARQLGVNLSTLLRKSLNLETTARSNNLQERFKNISVDRLLRN